MNYLNFDLDISPGDGRDYLVSVTASPAGEAREAMHFPFDELELKNAMQAIQIAILRSQQTQRRLANAHEQAVQTFGQQLFDALLTGEVRTCYDLSLREATRQEMGLRFKLHIRSPELAAVPWEFMYDRRQQEYICFSRNSPVVRYLDAQQPIQSLQIQLPLRILGMVASPHDLTTLDIDEEKQRVEQAIAPLARQGMVELVWVAGQTWRNLQRALQQGPWHVFHFIGHGGFDPQADEGLIALADDQGQTHFLNATQLGRLLVDHAPLRLVLLNSCEGALSSVHDLFSGSAATLVRRGMPAVIAMQFEISDQAAIEFAYAFYEALANGMPIDAAVAEARKAMSMALPNTVEWGTPVLFLRSPDGKIFQVAPASRDSMRPSGTPAQPTTAPAPHKPAESVNRGPQVVTPPFHEPEDQLAQQPPPQPRAQPADLTAQPRQTAHALRLVGLFLVLLITLSVGAYFWLNAPQPLVASPGMVKVNAGQYPIGDQQPQALTEFWLDRYEVTNAQFATFLARSPAFLAPLVHFFANTDDPQPADWLQGEIPAGLEHYPVRGIDWATATRYCAWAGKRLPTEAEWEGAARGPRGWLYPWGNEENAVELPSASTYTVGSLPTNRSYFGVYDMAGNVWEWVRDPYTPVSDGQQIMRGGAYDLRYDMKFPMVSAPNATSHHASLINTGFRCAADGTRVQPAPEPALLAVEDDFTLTNSGWPAVNENSFIVNYHPPDFYHVESRQANAYVAVFYPRQAFSSFVLETEVFVDAANTDHAHGNFEYGLAMRYQDNQLYAFVISANEQQWRVLHGRLAQDAYTGPSTDLTTLATGREEGIQGSSETLADRLVVINNGAAFSFRINGKIVHTFTAADYRTGQAGFVVLTKADVTKVHIHYQWVTVQKIEPFDSLLPRDRALTPQ